ncbi:MAG: hypothetical protein RL684_435 [Pseudomonadota bacterium]|jgi:peptidoglycan/LPS O-acetylase OafA/YrhL
MSETVATHTGKQHYAVLDGLRGSAALLVVAFHIQGIPISFQPGQLLLSHAHLAVDFFFALSGFVIGYAYDDRWGAMTTLRFFRVRLARLHPLVVLGALLGFASYLFDPFAAGAQAAPLGSVFVALLLGMLLLPASPLPNRWTDTHTLNGPSWTLLQEYIGNIAYALVLRRLPTRALALLALVAAAVLAWVALANGTLDRGWGWENFWLGTVRLAFPFMAGLWLHRVHARLPALRLGFLPLTIVLVAAFAAPLFGMTGAINANGLYEAGCVIVLFPLILVAGAHSQAGRGFDRLCRLAGELSYPLYITHFPFLYVWENYVAHAHPSPAKAGLIACLIFPFVIAVAWVAYRFWDLPIRRYLARR